VATLREKQHKAFGFFYRKRTEQHLVHERKDGGVRSDTQRERNDRDRRKHRDFCERSKGEADIGE
jgi:hypothetical protein